MTNSPGRQTVRHMLDGTFWVFAAQSLMIPSGLATLAYLARALGPVEYGNYAVTLAVIMWFEFSALALFGRSTIKFVSGAKQWQPIATSVLQLSLMLGITCTGIVWLLAEMIARILSEPQLAANLRLAALDIPLFLLVHAHLNVLVGQRRFRHRARVEAIRWPVRLMLIVLLVELEQSARSAILACIGTSLTELLVCRILCRTPLLKRSEFRIRSLIAFGVPLFFSAVGLRFLSRLDLLALKAIGATSAVAGTYAVALNVTLLSNMVGWAASPIVLATLSRLLRDRQAVEATKVVRQLLRCLFCTIPAAAVLGGAGTEVAVLVFGHDYVAAGPLLSVLVIAGVSQLAISLTGAMLTAADRPQWTVFAIGPAVPVALLAYATLIPRFESSGAAWGTVSACGFAAGVSFVAVYRVWSVTLPPSTVARCAIISAVAYWLSAVWPTPGALVILKLMLLTVAAGVALALCGEISAREVKSLRNLRFSRSRPSATAVEKTT